MKSGVGTDIGVSISDGPLDTDAGIDPRLLGGEDSAREDSDAIDFDDTVDTENDFDDADDSDFGI